MVKVLIALCILAAVQVGTAFQVKVPIFRQPYGYGGSRIVSGQNATRGQFPHQAGITIDGVHFCGGSLISKSWVLTAGHCIYEFKVWDVVLGAQNIRETEPGRVALRSTEAIRHQWYNDLSIWHDIGVIRLPQEVEFSKSEDLSPSLQFVDLTVITKEECSKTFGTLPDYQFCVSGENQKSTCNGDSGGGLTIGSEGDERVGLGIVSYGSAYGCAEGYPMGLTSIPFYVDWISNKTGIPVRE